jgi:hypothetical protein
MLVVFVDVGGVIALVRGTVGLQGGFDLENKKSTHGTMVEQHRDDTSVSADAPDWFKTKVTSSLTAFLSLSLSLSLTTPTTTTTHTHSTLPCIDSWKP